MICPMANNQIIISKKPKIGAKDFLPLETEIIRRVPRVTSITLAMKISTGRTNNENVSDAKINAISIFFCLFECIIHKVHPIEQLENYYKEDV